MIPTPHHISRTSTDEPCERGLFRRRGQRAGAHRLYLGNGAGKVDLHGLSQGQMDGKAIDILFIEEGTEEVGRDFTGRLVTNRMLQMDSQTN